MQSLDPKRKGQEPGKTQPFPQTENPGRGNKQDRSSEEEEVNYEEENDTDSDEQEDQDEQDDEEEGEDEERSEKKKMLDVKEDGPDIFNEHSPHREDAELGIGKSAGKSPSRPNTGSSGSRGVFRDDNNGRKGPGSTGREEGKKKANAKDRPTASKGTTGSNGLAAPAKGQDKKATTKNAQRSSPPKGKVSR